jgi:Protein of unknown function (DUF1203)
MTTLTRSYEIRAIDPPVAAALRDRDDAGAPPRIVVSDGRNPLRCCLQLSRPGERLALVSYAPLRRWALQTQASPGPYDEVGPVFIHPEPCDGLPSDWDPSEYFASPRVFRAYGSDGAILRGRYVPAGEETDAVITELLADPEVAVVHARALEFGCFTFEVRRAGAL